MGRSQMTRKALNVIDQGTEKAGLKKFNFLTF